MAADQREEPWEVINLPKQRRKKKWFVVYIMLRSFTDKIDLIIFWLCRNERKPFLLHNARFEWN